MVNRWLGLASLACLALVAFVGAAAAAAAAADPALGEARPWQIDLQPAFSPVMERVHDFHQLVMWIITGIVLVVLCILGFIIVKFNSKTNPVPSKTSHNTLLEFAWTVVPVIILVAIAIPSLKLLYYSNVAPKYDMTLKVTGHQWYWSYNYPDNGDFSFDSIPVPADDLQPGQPRLLSVDNPVVLPVGVTVQVLVASDDVIHDWAVPSLGLKKDATPGRVNETWVRVEREGTFYGMCSELCGVNHYFMPIQIQGVSQEAFAAWAAQAKEKFAEREGARVELATKDAVSR